MSLAIKRIESGSHVTLHYRLSALLDGESREVMSTLSSRPATIQIGAGQFSEPLERRLLGLAEGQSADLDFAAGEAFGQRNGDLVQRLARGTFDANAEAEVSYEAGDVVEFNSPDGHRFTGVLKSRDDDSVLVDFNHPLAGLRVRLSVQIIGVL
jgi:FKBP-type peptidyl-prolyl cis-trans isomerase SlpA